MEKKILEKNILHLLPLLLFYTYYLYFYIGVHSVFSPE